jgi:hypothetical protein
MEYQSHEMVRRNLKLAYRKSASNVMIALSVVECAYHTKAESMGNLYPCWDLVERDGLHDSFYIISAQVL